MNGRLIYDCTFEELKDILVGMGEKPFRAGQIFKWVYEGVSSFDEMTNISKPLRQKLAEVFTFDGVRFIKSSGSMKGNSEKLLLALSDMHTVESVLMRHEYGVSLCVSSQVGCKMHCAFCASGADGYVRNLTAGEIIAQVMYANKMLAENGEGKVSMLVFMGSGEPFDNFENVIKSIKIMHSPEGLNIGYRNFTISTSGLVEGIYSLAREELPINLSISLHAPDDELRKELMPIAKRHTIKELIEASSFYFNATGRRVTMEYLLIKDVTDTVEKAKQLASLLKHTGFHVNLIPYNEVEGLPYVRSSPSRINTFMDILKERTVNATCRDSLGKDINAACGQLKRGYVGN
ncbi:MAG: 23S rRNA (adenine(2503)-C(2))-methyltransferase RlmN [Clostridiales bacterium]|nr:23S rRNA (adenine(2503)-C(2))-methyltransferase RlmN [Clostridiales bacterium]